MPQRAPLAGTGRRNTVENGLGASHRLPRALGCDGIRPLWRKGIFVPAEVLFVRKERNKVVTRFFRPLSKGAVFLFAFSPPTVNKDSKI